MHSVGATILYGTYTAHSFNIIQCNYSTFKADTCSCLAYKPLISLHIGIIIIASTECIDPQTYNQISILSLLHSVYKY